jgi:hypothetical protein
MKHPQEKHEQLAQDLRRLNELAVQKIASRSDLPAILRKITNLASQIDTEAQDDEQLEQQWNDQ